MPGRDRLGAGRGARFHTFEHSGALRGARFVLRRGAADAITLAIENLVAEGFVARDDALDTQLRDMGSPWTARAVEIGDTKGSWAKGIVADLIEDTPLEFLTRLQRGVAHTLVMVTARDLPDATIELVLYPHASSRGDPGGWAGAAERLRTSYEAITALCAADGTLDSQEKLIGIRNDGSPASQEMVRQLLGWR